MSETLIKAKHGQPIISQATYLFGYNASILDNAPTMANAWAMDAVCDISRRLYSINPREAEQFTRVRKFTSNPISIDGVMITNVIRAVSKTIVSTDTLKTYKNEANESISDYRIVKRVHAGVAARLQDPESLHYRSKYNPVYFFEGQIEEEQTGNRNELILQVLPAPSTTSDVKVTYIPYTRRGSRDGFTWEKLNAAKHSFIEYFPDEMMYMVAKYIAIRMLEVKIQELTLVEEDIELATELRKSHIILKQEYEAYFPKPQKEEKEEEQPQRRAR
tara:strand:- start:606 stop:1430 length:825 start_codon:yes stop_codon:yes gene_type:complete